MYCRKYDTLEQKFGPLPDVSIIFRSPPCYDSSIWKKIDSMSYDELTQFLRNVARIINEKRSIALAFRTIAEKETPEEMASASFNKEEYSQYQAWEQGCRPNPIDWDRDCCPIPTAANDQPDLKEVAAMDRMYDAKGKAKPENVQWFKTNLRYLLPLLVAHTMIVERIQESIARINMDEHIVACKIVAHCAARAQVVQTNDPKLRRSYQYNMDIISAFVDSVAPVKIEADIVKIESDIVKIEPDDQLSSLSPQADRVEIKPSGLA